MLFWWCCFEVPADMKCEPEKLSGRGLRPKLSSCRFLFSWDTRFAVLTGKWWRYFSAKKRTFAPGGLSHTRHVIKLSGGMQIFVLDLRVRLFFESDNISFVAKLEKVERFDNTESTIIKFNNF